MVNRKTILGILLGASLLAVGCQKGSTPVSPLSAGTPSAQIDVAQLNKSILLYGYTDNYVLKYYVRGENQNAIIGTKTFSTTDATVPPLNIALPYPGAYTVALEIFYVDSTYDGGQVAAKVKANSVRSASVTPYMPVYIGAEKILVKGLTPVVMKLGRLDTSCYSASMGYGYDYFSFNSNASNTYGPSDIQFYEDPNYPYFYDGGSGTTSFLYLGNGDLVDNPEIPANATFSSDSYVAKGNQYLQPGDVFAVKLGNQNATVWMQVTSTYVSYSSMSMNFNYRWNNDGYNYPKFDMTDYGQLNCNDSLYLGTPSNLVGHWTGFGNPQGLDLDAAGNLYVADTGSNYIMVLDAVGNTTYVGSGQFNTLKDVAVSKGSPATVYALDSGAYQVKTFTSAGVTIGSFNLSHASNGIAVDGNGQVFVTYADYTIFNGVGKFDYLGAPVTEWGSIGPGSGPGQFNGPTGIATGPGNKVYVADPGNSRVQVFDNNGAYLRETGSLSNPYDVAVDGSGNFFVACGGMVYKFDPNGTALSSFSSWYDSLSNYHYFYTLYGLAVNGTHLFATSNSDQGYTLDKFIKP